MCNHTSRFNPTMVRLLHAASPCYLARLAQVSIPQWCDCCRSLSSVSMIAEYWFQSHNGAIAARCIAVLPCETCASFNPTMVRLLPLIKQCVYDRRVLVSIPQWCDCCHNVVQTVLSGFVVSIPQWCDCCEIVERNTELTCNVSIPQWCDCCGYRLPLRLPVKFGFNPTMVRLLHGDKFKPSDLSSFVSIPQWCDCC